MIYIVCIQYLQLKVRVDKLACESHFVAGAGIEMKQSAEQHLLVLVCDGKMDDSPVLYSNLFHI